MGIPVATITSGNAALDEKIELLTLEVRRELNKIPEATLTVLDGSVARRVFEVSDLAFFEPGKTIKISLRYEGSPPDVPVFEGLVVRQAVESSGEGSTLRVDLKDSAFKLTRIRKTVVYRGSAPDKPITDDKVIKAVITDGQGTVGTVDPATTGHMELVQYNATNWDFLLTRADVLGRVVNVHMGSISVVPIDLSAVKKKLEHGLGDVSELNLELDASAQWAAVKGIGWDLPAGAAAGPEAATDPALTVGNLPAASIASIAKLLGGDEATLLHPAVFRAGELKAWADARFLRSRFAMLRGRAVVAGNADLAPMDTVEVLGVGARFNGKLLVSGVTHKLDQNGWQTELQLGLSPEWFARQPDIADVPAGGLLPPVRGLQIATVASLDEDPSGELRVQVKLPALADNQGFLWARLATPDAGAKRGFGFRPEIGDEVVLGFLDDDPRQSVILGSLFSSRNLPPQPVEKPTDKNDLRAIVSRAGTRIVFDDENLTLTLETTADGSADGSYQNKILMDQKNKVIQIVDEHGNEILMNKDGIKLTSAKDFTVDAPGKVVIKGATVDLQ